jgi:hypothetical protein
VNRKNRANFCNIKHITRDVRNRQANFDPSDDWIKMGIKLLERAKRMRCIGYRDVGNRGWFTVGETKELNR